MPQKVLYDSLILIAYNHVGAGHYDAVVPKLQPHETPKNNLNSHTVDVVSMGMSHPVLIRAITIVVVSVTK